MRYYDIHMSYLSHMINEIMFHNQSSTTLLEEHYYFDSIILMV